MTTGAVELRERLERVLKGTNWDKFKTDKTLIPSLEIHALLINAIKKTDKMIDSIMADTIHDKE